MINNSDTTTATRTRNVFNSETEREKNRDKQCVGERVCAAMEIKGWNDRYKETCQVQ